MSPLVTHPWVSKAVPVLPTAVKVDVMAGMLYELTTDAQVIDDETGAVTYPLLYVVVGTDVKTFSRKMALPFHRMRPIVVQPASNSLIVSGDVAATVWVARLARPGVILRAPVPGGADCGCGCKKSNDDDDDDDDDKPCGCKASGAQPLGRW